MDFLISVDHALLTLINSTLSHPWLDAFFPAVTDLHKHPVFAVLPAALVWGFWRRWGRQGFLFAFGLVVSMALTDLSSTQLFKKPIDRPRPFATAGLEVIKRSPASPGMSFVSNHAANMFSLAAYVALFLPRWSPWLFAVAMIAAYSRVYNGVHFPSDVVAGGLWGILIGSSMARIARRFVPASSRVST